MAKPSIKMAFHINRQAHFRICLFSIPDGLCTHLPLPNKMNNHSFWFPEKDGDRMQSDRVRSPFAAARPSLCISASERKLTALIGETFNERMKELCSHQL
jgi:hypothetical protein